MQKVRIIDLVLNIYTVLCRGSGTSAGFLLSTSSCFHYLYIHLRWWREYWHTFLQVYRKASAKAGARYILLQLRSMVVLNFVYKTRIILWKMWVVPSKDIFMVARNDVLCWWYESTFSNKLLQLYSNGSKVNCLVRMIGSTLHSFL